MKTEKTDTRQLLLETAGRLFAEYGFKGTSIKMIAEASEQNIAAVNYHFGSKQKLFISTLKFVVDKVLTPVPRGRKAKSLTPAEELQIYINERCNFLFSSKTPSWYGKLIVRSGFEMPAPARQAGIEFYKPDFDYLESMARRVNPALSPEKARYWAYSVVGQVFFYVFGREMILEVNQIRGFDAAKIKNIASHISELSASWLTSSITA